MEGGGKELGGVSEGGSWEGVNSWEGFLRAEVWKG